MNFLRISILSIISFLFINQISAQQFKVLLITETLGYQHGSISNGIKAIDELAATHNFAISHQQNNKRKAQRV